MNEAANPLETEPATALDQARAGIDAVDDDIHALLMRRAELVRLIGSAKRGGGGAYRPAREAHILRRLHAKTRPPLDFEIVYRLWREMIGGFTAMQAPLRVSVPRGSGLDRIARDHFGAAAVVNDHDGPPALHAAMQADPSLLAVVPAQGWRSCLGENAPLIVALLPVYGNGIEALCLASAHPQESGDDLTLFSVRGGTSASLNCLATEDSDSLVALPGFRHDDPSAIAEVATDCGVEASDVQCVGAVPVPIAKDAP